MRKTLTLAMVLSLLSLGCSTDTPTPSPTSTPVEAIDLQAERAALLDADRGWYEDYSSSDSPVDAFADRVTADAVLLPPEAPLARGREAIRATIGALEGMPGFSVGWSATEAELSAAADLGYTIGTYEMTMDGPDGTPMQINGKYLTVWRKQADGSWMVTADMFNTDAPPMGVEQ